MQETEIKVDLQKFRLILNKRPLAHLDTHLTGNSLQTTPVWFDLENDHIRVLVAGEGGNLNSVKVSSPVGLYVQDPDNPYNHVTIRGIVVECKELETSEYADLLAKRYLNLKEYPYRIPGEIQRLYRIKPTLIFGNIE